MTGAGTGGSAYWRGMALTITAAILWGSTYPVIQIGLGYYSAFQISFLRALFATVTLVAFFSLTAKGRKQLNIVPRDPTTILLFVATAVFGAAGFWTLLNLSVSYLAADTSSFLVALYPLIAIVLASFVLRERLTTPRVLGVSLGLFGTYVIVGIGDQAQLAGPQPFEGALMALGAAFTWACFLITTKILIGRVDARTGSVFTAGYVTLATFAISVAPTLAIVLLAGSWGTMLSASVYGIAAVLYLGILASALAFLLFNKGMEIIGVSRAAINQLLFPPVAVISSYLLLGETVSLVNILGIALILLGVWVAQARGRFSSSP